MGRRKPGVPWTPSQAQIRKRMPQPFMGFASVEGDEAVLITRPGWRIILWRMRDWDPWAYPRPIQPLVDAEGVCRGDVYGCGAEFFARATWDPARHLREMEDALDAIPDLPKR